MLPILILLASIEPGQPIAAEVSWAVAPDDGPRDFLEQMTGQRIDPRSLGTIREGDMVFTGESLARDLLGVMGAPLPSLDHPPTPGVLVLAMDGVTLKPTCPGTQMANGALNCSPLVDGETTFPSVSSDAKKSSILQAMKTYYADFDLVIATQRPPDYLPYTLSVIGGTSGNAGYENGVCGIANVACDGAKRNHVSLSFSDSCPGDAALTAGQETAHNWGLEHTDLATDIMYPYVAGAGKFLDQCMDISHATGNGQTQCTFVHKVYCPEGDGEQQNSYGELMGVFGPKKIDTTKPTIVSINPDSGSVFTTADTIKISALLADDSNMLGVKWTWIDGLPEDYKEDGYTRCTNDVCTDTYGAWKAVDDVWDFINLQKPPAGHYSFKLEIMDAYGNNASQMLEFDVMQGDTPTTTTGETTGDPETTGGTESGETPTTGGGEADSGDTDTPTGGGESSATNATSATAGTLTDATAGVTATDPGEGDDGCGCRSPSAPPISLALLGLLGLVRRRRPARVAAQK